MIESLSSLNSLQAESIRSLADIVYRHDDMHGISEQPLVHLEYPGYNHYLIHADGNIIAYAHLTADKNAGTVELIVHPAYRNRGYASALIAHILRSPVSFWAYGNMPAAQHLAKRYTLGVKRTLLQMSMNLSDMTLASISADNIIIRIFHPGDETGILAVNNAAFLWHPEQGHLKITDIEERLNAPWFDPKGLFIAEYQGKIIGFHWTKIHTDHKDPIGEIYILAVDPAMNGKGIGKALTYAGLEYFLSRRLSSTMLYVEADNIAAYTVYTQFGYTTTQTHCLYGR